MEADCQAPGLTSSQTNHPHYQVEHSLTVLEQAWAEPFGFLESEFQVSSSEVSLLALGVRVSKVASLAKELGRCRTCEDRCLETSLNYWRGYLWPCNWEL